MIQRKCGYRLKNRLNYTQMNIVKQPNQLHLSTVFTYLDWVTNTCITYRSRLTEVVHYYKTDYKWCIIIYYTYKLCTKTIKANWLQIDLILNTVYTGV